MYEPMVKGICGAHRVHTNPSKEEEKKRCVAVKCFEGSGRYRRWFERISTLVVCKKPYRSEYNKVDSPPSLSHLFGKAYIPNRKWARRGEIVQ